MNRDKESHLTSFVAFERKCSFHSAKLFKLFEEKKEPNGVK
jgi:hypothetical protein